MTLSSTAFGADVCSCDALESPQELSRVLDPRQLGSSEDVMHTGVTCISSSAMLICGDRDTGLRERASAFVFSLPAL